MRKLLALLLLILAFAAVPAQQGAGPGPGVKTYGGGGGGPFVNDTFTEASDTNLQSHTGETGATWTLHPSYSGTALVNGSLDRAYLNTSAAAAYTASGSPPSADYCVESPYRRLTQISTNVTIALGMDTSADTFTGLRLNDNGATVVWETYDRVTGSNTVLQSVTTNIPSLGGAAITAKLCRSGTAITVFFDNVQNTSLNSTTTITAAGKAGVRFSGQGSATTGIQLDSFSAQ